MNLAVTFDTAGKVPLIAETMALDGCLLRKTKSFDVLTCHPKLEADTKPVSAAALVDADNALVCNGGTYTGEPQHVYVRADGSFGGDGKGIIWLEEGGKLANGLDGSWTVLYAGSTVPMEIGGADLVPVACPSLSFDTSAMTESCP